MPMIDLHCHILPGVDDGAANMAESLLMAKGLSGLGFSQVCVTPHIPWHTNPLDGREVERRCAELGAALQEQQIAMAVTPAAEHFVHLVPELLQTDGLVCFPRGDTFLMEFPLSGIPLTVWELLFRIQVKGKVPVIAHLERYPEVQKDPQLANKLREKGCYSLINLTSLVGKWSRESKQAARELLKLDLVDAVSSDLHAAEEVPAVAVGLKDLEERVGAERLKRLTISAPAEIAGLAS